VLYDDETREMAKEIVRNDALDRVHMALDFFDASINRISAWCIGFRSWQKALLNAMLTPHETLRSLQNENELSELMAMLEEIKFYPVADVWNEYLDRNHVVSDEGFFAMIKQYEEDVLRKRG